LIVALLSAFSWLRLKSLQATKKADTQRAEIVTRKVVRYEQGLKKRAEVNAENARFDEKIRQNPATFRILRLVSNVFPRNLSLVSLKIGTAANIAKQAGQKTAAPAAKPQTPGKPDAAAEKEPILLRIDGESKTSIPDIRVSVAQFMLDLSKSGYITDVKLQDEKIIEKTDEFIFNLEGTVNY
jgi:hypothetical protein